ncbi:C2 calcium-dependent membrane targeting [Cynara cardunculus var. scolymus]|uniref:C2 calcium-dependent membrane targeting n=1 Tax=Cynara cardunculus var. scolymus TaxID=59895 RepID=A0A118K6K2_CYNCS|nr:C2 calcium-dependent membrane targeting [Cynara cardunculus var. scolymus]
MYNHPSISPSADHHSLMTSHSIHGSLLEVTVVSCNNLKDTEWISRQDPYVCVEYGSIRSSTRTCKDGGKNPTFQEKFVYSLVEGLRDLNITVWNSNTLTHDDLIGNGRVPLTKALSQGFDDSSWPLQSKTGRHAGEVRLIMHYSNANKPAKDNAQKPGKGFGPSAPPPYVTGSAPPAYMYAAPPPAASYPPSPYPSYPQNSGVYPYPPPQTAAPYPPHPYPPNPAPYGSHYPPGN